MKGGENHEKRVRRRSDEQPRGGGGGVGQQKIKEHGTEEQIA